MTKKTTATDKAKVTKAIEAKDTTNPLNAKRLYTTTAQITEAAVKASKSGMKVQQEYQKIACSAIVHLGTHKDIRVIRNILETLPVSMRKQSLSAYFNAFAPVSFDAEGQINYDKSKPVKLADALKTSWWLVAKEAVYKPYIFEAELARLLATAEKRVLTATEDKGDMITTAQVKALAKFVAKLKPIADVRNKDVLAA